MIAGLYLTFKPKHSLMYMYQDVMAKVTKKPLKDEDFPLLAFKIQVLKCLGIPLLLLSTFLIFFL